MTEQQASSPIDDLFRKTLENLPDTPAESGWDTPSDRVWQHVQANMAKPRNGLSLQSILLLTGILLALCAGLYWILKPAEKPATPPNISSPVEEPVASPSAPLESDNNQNNPVTVQKPSTGNSKEKTNAEKPNTLNQPGDQKVKPGQSAAQPLPGSKQTLPPNSTEAQKKKSNEN